MLAGIINYLSGYVKVRATGPFYERFINLCGTNNRDIWDIKIDENSVIFFTKAKEYKRLKTEARKSSTKIRILKKYGLPFLINKNRKRYGIPVGLMLSLLLICYLSGFVWNIEIKGNHKLSSRSIDESLSSCGVFVGMKKSDLDPQNAKEKVMAKYSDISWMSINPIGTTLYVDISERVSPPNLKNDEEPCHIVAKCDGVIKSIKVTEGRAMVKVGDAVVKGDLLVSGIVEYSNGVTVLKSAKGEVVAQTQKQYSSEKEYLQKIEMKTGRIKNRTVLHFFNISIPLYIGQVKGNYDRSVTTNYLTINKVKLPLGISKGKFEEKCLKEQIISKEDALEEAKNDIESRRKSDYEDAESKLLKESIECTETGVVVVKEYCGIENIGIVEKVLIF